VACGHPVYDHATLRLRAAHRPSTRWLAVLAGISQVCATIAEVAPWRGKVGGSELKRLKYSGSKILPGEAGSLTPPLYAALQLLGTSFGLH
jgi:hypothetical protein